MVGLRFYDFEELYAAARLEATCHQVKLPTGPVAPTQPIDLNQSPIDDEAVAFSCNPPPADSVPALDEDGTGYNPANDLFPGINAVSQLDSSAQYFADSLDYYPDFYQTAPEPTTTTTTTPSTDTPFPDPETTTGAPNHKLDSEYVQTSPTSPDKVETGPLPQWQPLSEFDISCPPQQDPTSQSIEFKDPGDPGRSSESNHQTQTWKQWRQSSTDSPLSYDYDSPETCYLTPAQPAQPIASTSTSEAQITSFVPENPVAANDNPKPRQTESQMQIPIQSSTTIPSRSSGDSEASSALRRARNTLAARRSRARKADKLADLRRENEGLAMRVCMLTYENEMLCGLVKDLRVRLGEC